MVDKQETSILPTIEAAKRKLESLPCIEAGNLLAFAVTHDHLQGLSDISVNWIVSPGGYSSWNLPDNSMGSVYSFADKISKGKIDLNKKEPPALFSWFGLYGVWRDGNHRVAALKLTDNQNISAEVYIVDRPSEFVIFTPEDMTELEERRNQGLWSGGSFVGGPTDSFPDFYAKCDVRTFEGPWVFARDMVLAKKVFQQVRPDLYPAGE